MAYPSGVITRPVTFGPAFELEDGDVAGMTVAFKATRPGVLWMATGSPAVSTAITRNADDGVEQVVYLPVTDQTGWGDGDGNAIVPGEDGHVFLYSVSIVFTQNGRTIPGAQPRSKTIAIPAGDLSPIDLDKIVPLTSPGGTVVSLPDIWSGQIAAAEAAAEAAQAAVISSSTFVRVTNQTDMANPASQLSMDVAAKQRAYSQRKLIATDLDLREWVEEGQLDNDEDGNNTPLFTEVMADLKGLYDDDGLVRKALAPAGRYGFDSRLTPALGGHFGIKGEGAGRTTFVTAASNSWLGMDSFQVGDPDFQWSDMVFEDFTIDGTNQPVGSSYSSGLKGFIMHNFRDTYFRRVKVYNTHATGFGIDFSDNVWFIECVADSCGRARKVHDPDPTTRFGSGSGFGIGFGQKPDESIYIVDSVARNNGAAGIFGEHLNHPAAPYKSTGLVVQGALVEYNAIGMNDTGTRGTQVTDLTARHNDYAGYRVGVSNASEQGGVDGQVKGLTSYGNLVGIALEGSADGSYLFDGVEVFGNSRAGVEWREGSAAWPGRHVRFRSPHVHDNGGPGFLGTTTKPIVGLEITSADVHDNAGDGFSFYSPLSRPKITGKAWGNAGYAIALRGGASTERPKIELDVHGSANGGLMNQHVVDVTTDISVTGNPTTVTQAVTRPIPDSSLTGYSASNATLSYVADFVDAAGTHIGPHALATATGTTPRAISESLSVTAFELVTLSKFVTAPAGRSVQLVALFSGGATQGGPIQRATGAEQRLSFTIQVPAGATSVQIAASGASSNPPWVAGDQLRGRRANITRGGMLWPYIDGSRPNCAWNGTAGASASTLTIPVYAPVLGFDDNFDRADGAVGTTPQGKPWLPFASSGSPVAMVIASGKAKMSTSGTLSGRVVWLAEGDGANGVLEGKIGATGEHQASWIIRGTDAQNYIALEWAVSTSVFTYRLTKRVGNTLSVVASSSSVASADGDTATITLAGTSIEVKINGSTIFGGPQTVSDFSTVTKHGVLLSSSSSARNESFDSIKFTPTV